MNRERGNHSVAVALITQGGIPVVLLPETDKANAFAMLVYSFVKVSGGNLYVHYTFDVGNRKLLIYQGKKLIFSAFYRGLKNNQISVLEQLAENVVTALDNKVLDEGIVDSELSEEAKIKIINGLKEAGISLSGLEYMYRKIAGDLYRIITEASSDGVNLKSNFRLAFFPKITDPQVIEEETNLRLKQLLKLCDGNYSLEYISRALGMSKAQLYRHVASYIRSKRMILELGFELVI